MKLKLNHTEEEQHTEELEQVKPKRTRTRLTLEERNRLANERFANATPAQKRVLIAKDVLKQIAAKRYTPTRGTWASIQTPLSMIRKLRDDWRGFMLSNKEEYTQANCTCCAVGAMFLSAVRQGGCATSKGPYVSTGADYGDFAGYPAHAMDEYFDMKQKCMIETAFEGEGGLTEKLHAMDRDEYQSCSRWGANNKYDHPTTRLNAICNNLIRNNGTFVSSQK